MTPIVTNLAGSPPVWIRLEASLVFDDYPEDADMLSARISEDIVGFLRTVSMQQIEGAIGFQHLTRGSERPRARAQQWSSAGTRHSGIDRRMKRGLLILCLLLLSAVPVAAQQLPSLDSLMPAG